MGRMDSYEFAEWLAFEELSPGDPERADLWMASIRWQIWAMLHADKHEERTLESFMLFHPPQRPPPKESVESKLDKLMNWHFREAENRKG